MTPGLKWLLLVALLANPLMAGAQRGRPAAIDGRATYAGDVAPILEHTCVPCHRPDGPAPFSLTTYADARRRAAQIVAVTTRRYMPPWKPDADGPAFVGERRLTPTELNAIERWVQQGLAEGNEADSPRRETDGSRASGRSSGPAGPGAAVAGRHALADGRAETKLGEPDLVLTLPEYALRPDGRDVFRNFVVSVPGAGTRYVRALEFRPSHRAVHHANIRVDPTPASRRQDAADPAPGYEGAILRTADYPDGHFLGWTPGQSPVSSDLAWRLDAGADLVVQLHMQPTGKPERIRPSIALYFTADTPSRTPTIVRLGRQNLDIPAGASAYRVTDRYVLPVDAELRAIQPHAHYRARSVKVWATEPAGVRRPLLRIHDWDFNWQDQYRYASPFWVAAGTTIEMEYLFDNSDANPRNPDKPAVRAGWGWRSSDEMADVWIQLMTRSDVDRERLARDVRRKMAAEDAIGCEVVIAREPDYADLRNDAATLYLELGEPEQALRHFTVVGRLQPQSAVARYNIGVALEGTGRNAEAAREYEAALRLDPAYAVAHNNLGTLRLAEGKLDEARRHYEQAVASAPANAEAQNNVGAALLATGDAATALAHLQESIRLRPVYAEAHFNLARAFAMLNRIGDAIQTGTVAEAQAVAAGKTTLTAQIREQLRLYRAAR